ncbi:hypothetical protein ANN_10149 [Periplaneta americana]|uniref:Uncharacterized protein n=1 Tax=Periplaneta americana TaxID=6978 RepID=A0ABQ8TNJ8_PERAM|nr:hypothetical protein ANN_10149 [Periplaneta americana]
MSPESSTESYPAFARIGLRENPGKKPQPGNLPRPGFEPGPPGFAARRADRYSTARTGESRNAYSVLVGTPEGKRPLERPRRRWEDDIKLDLKHVGYDDRDWINLAHNRDQWRAYVMAAMNLRVFKKPFENIWGKRDEVTGEWRKLHNAGLHAPDIIMNIKSRRLRWAGHVARIGESRIAYRVLVGRPEGKRPLGRPRRRWEDNIKLDLREVGYDCRDWINAAQDRDRWRAYVMDVMNLRVP